MGLETRRGIADASAKLKRDRAVKDEEIAKWIRKGLPVGRVGSMAGVDASRVHRVAEEKGLTIKTWTEFLREGGDL